MTQLKAGRYELIEEVGRGAMGVVFKAFDPMIGRTVAVKTMRLSDAVGSMQKQEILHRFQTEARAAGQLVHPNIVVIHDAGEEEGLYYITMEFVDGRSLQALLDARQPFPLPRIMRVFGQACSALEYAHQRSVVHRDVKPANFVLTSDDTLKVTDFGTAKILAMNTSHTGTIVGTPSYMAPEQVKGKPVDGRSDIFSLGVILYELVTGQKPFPGDNVTTVIYKIVNEEPMSPREIDSSVHPGLEQVIRKALAKEPEQRYQTCRELMQELLNYRALGMPSGAGFDATMVVVGRPGPSLPAPPALPQHGTLPGAPALDSQQLRGPNATPQSPRPAHVPAMSSDGAAGRAVSGAATSIMGGMATEPPPASRSYPPLPRPMTLPPLPVDSQRIEDDFIPVPKRNYTWVVVIVLLIAVGLLGNALWPVLRDNFFPEVSKEVRNVTSRPSAAAAAETETKSEPKAEPPADAAKSSEPVKAAKEPPKKEEAIAPPKAAPKPEVDTTAVRAAIQRDLRRLRLERKVAVDIRDNVVHLSGELSPFEMRALRRRVLAPQGLSINYDITEAGHKATPEHAAAKTPPAKAQPGKAEEEADPAKLKPKTAQGLAEIEVLTDVNGARVVLTGPDGKQQEGTTPHRFEDLPPGRYTLEITKPGFRTERRIVQARAGNVSPVQISFEAAVGRLNVLSQPRGAQILVDGRAAGVTPATVVVSPGTHRVRVEKEGFAPVESTVQVGENELLKFDTGALAPQSPQAARGPGRVEVRTIPPGADILINSASTGKKTPDTLELQPGEYTITLYLKGFQVQRETVAVKTGQTINLNRTLAPQSP